MSSTCLLWAGGSTKHFRCIPDDSHSIHCCHFYSYDAVVRLFDARNIREPLITANAGGGAWRVKWHPDILRKTDLLVACMHDGFKVVHFEIQPDPGAKQSEGRTTFVSYTIAARNDDH